MQIIRKMELIESDKIELKSKLTDDLEKEIVAFLNSKEGGDIYIGVSSQGEIIGINDVDTIDKTQLRIVDRIKSAIEPATLGLFDVKIENIDGKNIIHIIISSGPDKPYYVKKHGMSVSGCFIRVGSSSQPMDTPTIEMLYNKRTKESLSKIESNRQNLTFEQLKIYYEAKGKVLNDKFLENLDLLTKDGKLNYVAYLLSDDNGTSIKVAKYKGTDKCDLVERNEYGYCSLIKATKSVLDKLDLENKTITKITSKERMEQRLVDPTALREAVINAIVHNDYTKEVPPVFEIYSDRITITSYGGLVSGLSRDDFFGCRSMCRNRELMRIYQDLELVEQLGSGMSRILKKYDESIFDITENFLVVTFKFPNEYINDPNVNKDIVIGEQAVQDIDNNGIESGIDNGIESGIDNYFNFDKKIKLSKNHKIVMKELIDNPYISMIDIAMKNKIGERTVARILKSLKENQYIKRIGPDHGGYWKVIKHE